jgi:hypothetical protein
MDENRQLMIETLEEMKNYIPKVLEAINGMVRNFQTDNEQDGIKVFGPFTEGIQWILEALSLTKDLQQESGMDIDITDINNTLKEMLEGWENGDYILISDLLEYEIYPLLKKWYEELQKLPTE